MPAPTATSVADRARATYGGAVVAESDAAVRLDVGDAAPRLWFPRADVDAAALSALDRGAWQEGEGDLMGHVAFDHEAVDLVLVGRVADDPGVGGDPLGETTTRFPCWGDATDLVAVLDVRRVDHLRYEGAVRSDWRRPVVEGSQLLGEAIVAASRHAPGRRAVHASMVFTRAVDARHRHAIELEEVAGGRTFAAVAARAVQGGRTAAAGTVLLDVTADDVIRHAAVPPDVAPPAEAVPYDMGVTGRELRIADATYTGDPAAAVGPPEIDAWVRFRGLPDDPPVHAALVAQFTGHMSIAAALRPHAGIGQDQAHRSLSTAINAISISFHADVRADRWVLYHHRSTVAADGMTHSECRVFDEEGAHLASFTVDAMVRAFADPARGSDSRTAL